MDPRSDFDDLGCQLDGLAELDLEQISGSRTRKATPDNDLALFPGSV